MSLEQQERIVKIGRKVSKQSGLSEFAYYRIGLDYLRRQHQYDLEQERDDQDLYSDVEPEADDDGPEL